MIGATGVRCDREAETAVLGAVLLENEAFLRARPLVRPEDFYFPNHGIIWEAMGALSERREPVDVVTLASELRRRNRLNAIGGAQFLGELTDGAVTTQHVEAHARLVAEAARARRLRDLGVWLMSRSADPAVSPDEIEAEATRRLVAINAGTSRDALRTQADVVCSLMEQVETLSRGGVHSSVVPMGLPSVDDRLGGARAGELIVIAARPGMGKTAFVEGWGTFIARRCRDIGEGVVLWFSEEMPAEALLNRRLAGDAGVNARGASAGIFSPDEFSRYLRAANEAAGLPILWHDAQRVSMRDIAMISRRAACQHGRVALVIVDYLQRLAPMNPLAAEGSRNQDVGAAAREAKTLGRELTCPIALLSQLNRSCESRTDKRPVMSDLRESGEIEQEADAILFLYRESEYDKSAPPDRAELIIGKMRGAAKGTVDLIFDGARTRFLDPAEVEGACTSANSGPPATITDESVAAGGWDDSGSAVDIPFGEFKDDYAGGYPVTSRGGDAE